MRLHIGLLTLSMTALAVCSWMALPEAIMTKAQEAKSTDYKPRSGYDFLAPGTKSLQDDDFQNPGMFMVDRGRDLWSKIEGSQGKSCASCHGQAESTMKGIAARYPLYDSKKQQLMNLELRINAEREDKMGAKPYEFESSDLLAITAYLSFQSRGEKINVDISGPAAIYYQEGRDFYNQRRGQLDLNCAQCHDDHVGAKLRGDVISQGQINGFPLYRLSWRTLLSRHRIFIWCNTSVRAEPYAYGSREYLGLELFLAARGNGLPIEAPAVRR
ncbi:MAG: sulfur oxidation c-type cytochrome SoxA [Alphaproteobacteria bacterium]|nr:sulfur oxidation c-type cytochrome SoxA [Alphaproteobacteria bacterium]